ncbi:hypothetical protein H310_11687 [Aphanomyces invadans]|uniref:Uncharacterized protein n=1 Tax=Aphanomyces invadans TaxID=157072 RepID=A0A024TL34_9STRA|nr:hypothetical protein H310_11687 [Aphanomyces invadans]ETV94714.1 hypothetical protein H310_11687 [Aphanomyces invadans]|eukprot:XP_008876659.1 hypothetical protein H310_11687 [Aphanomyces invadans]
MQPPKIWYLQVLDVATSVCVYSKQWHWHEDARVEGLRALVHSFSQFAREIDGGPVQTVHFGQSPSIQVPRWSSKAATSMAGRRYSTSLRQNLLQSRSSNSGSNYGTSPAAPALCLNTSTSPSVGAFHAVSPQSSPNLHSPQFSPAKHHLPHKLQMLSVENDNFQVVLFHNVHNDDVRGTAQILLDSFTSMFHDSKEYEAAKPIIQSLLDKDENRHLLGLFQRFDPVVADVVVVESCDSADGIQTAQV